jgi:flagellar FliL protein
MAEQNHPAGETEVAGVSLMAKIKVLASIAGLVLVECLTAYFLIPGPNDVIRAAEAQIRYQYDDEDADFADRPINSKDETIEVDLKEFGITNYRPLSESTMRIDFHLYATIASKDRPEFEALMEKHANRFREQVLVTVRSSDERELTDPTLGLLKRKILEKTNRILGKPMIRSMVFSDFSFVEQ